jgi:hypothetical protein
MNMKLLLALLTPIVQQLVTAGLFKLIQDAVKRIDASTDDGAHKRAVVIATVANHPLARQAAGWAINLAIETAVAKLRVAK